MADAFHKVVATCGPGSKFDKMRNTLIKYDTLIMNLKDHVLKGRGHKSKNTRRYR